MLTTDVVLSFLPPSMKWAVPFFATIIPLMLAALCMLYTRRGSPLRLIPLLVGVPIFRLAYLTSQDFSTSGFWSGYISSSSFFGFCIIANLLWFKGIDATDVSKLKTSYGYRWGGFPLAFALMINLRGICTPFLAKNTPPWPKWYGLPGSDPKLAGTTRRPAPKTRVWMLRTLVKMAWQAIMIDLVISLPQPKPAIEMFPPGSEWRYFGVSREEWINRMIQAPMNWWVMARLVIDLTYHLSAVVSVLLGIGGPEDWPPMMNRMSDAYTLRHYWG
jgi:hypothetical protein